MRPLVLTPPRVVVDDDLAWLLRAAFASDVGEPAPRDEARGLDLARTTELSGRIAQRLAPWRAEVGAIGREINADYYSNIARESLLAHSLDRIAELAERLETPLVVVKFAGLRRANLVKSGTRTFGDLDLLIPRAQATTFWQALVAAGFSRTHTHEYAHQLEALVDPDGVMIDVHRHLPGVFVTKGELATAERLIGLGLVTRTARAVLVPRAEVLAAHAIVHALIQNLSTPQTYSPLRMIADIADLRRVQPNVVQLAKRYLAPELGVTCDALERLSASLALGTFDGVGFDGTTEQILLWHCLAARLDSGYSERLRAAGLANKLRDGSSWLEIARYLADLLYPAEPALEYLYGPAAGRLGRIRRRLGRPVDLAVRAVRRWARSRRR